MPSVRLPMYWAGIQPETPFVSEPDFDGFDHEVRLAAEHDIRVMPFVWGSPEWAAARSIDLPVATSWQRWGWAKFLRDAVDRYGPYGTFWVEHPTLPYLPIRSLGDLERAEHRHLLELDRPGPLRDAAPRLGAGPARKRPRRQGPARRPLRPPAADPAQHGLRRLALAPLQGRQRQALLRRRRPAPLRGRRGGDAGSDPQPASRDAPPSRRAHAALPDRDRLGLRQLRVALGAGPPGPGQGAQRGDVDACRQPPRVADRRVWWFSWADLNDSCQFCDSAGLLTINREAKPAWYLFNGWTGGDPSTVPRAGIGDAESAPPTPSG